MNKSKGKSITCSKGKDKHQDAPAISPQPPWATPGDFPSLHDPPPPAPRLTKPHWHGRRKQELARAHEIVLAPALEKARASGVEASGIIRYGQVVELVVEETAKAGGTVIFVGRSGSQSMAARVFGSVPLGLAQVAPVPTVIVP